MALHQHLHQHLQHRRNLKSLAEYKNIAKRFTNRNRHYVTCHNDPNHIYEIFLRGEDSVDEEEAQNKALRRSCEQHNIMNIEKFDYHGSIESYIKDVLGFPYVKSVRETKFIFSENPICPHVFVNQYGIDQHCHKIAQTNHEKWKDEKTCHSHKKSMLLHRVR